MCDTTVAGSGKNGLLFTDDKLYYKELMEKPVKIWYEDIKLMKIEQRDKERDKDRYLVIKMEDGTEVKITSLQINKEPLYNFLRQMKKIKAKPDIKVNYKKGRHQGSFAGGYAAGNYGTVNKLYDEEKFHASRGHGFAAEKANHLYDTLTGKDAKIVGDSNAKNGADRVVNGIEIQSKYCQTGSKCIAECFKDGKMRYTIENGTKPMQIEVPADKYEDAVRAMQNRIKQGQVPGVTDPEEAKNIVRKGHFMYNQVKNIAKAGTVESIAYDSVNGVIVASSALGISAVVTFATSVWNGEEFDVAVKAATYSGLKVGGVAFVTTVLASQLSKAGLNSALVTSSEAIARLLGPKASAAIVNAFRPAAVPIHGAAAMKSCAKLLRGNIITAGVTVAIFTSVDVVNIFRSRISGKQLFKNFASTTTTVAGGAGGWVAGAAAGSIIPGPGTIIGGVVGAVSVGAIAGKATDKVMDNFIEEDADEMVKIIEKEFVPLAEDYLLNAKEAEKCVDRLRDELSAGMLKSMFASDNRQKFARDLLTRIIEKEVSKRPHIIIPSEEVFQDSIKEILEEISDNCEA